MLLQLKAEPRRSRRFVVADDLFEISNASKPKTTHFLKKTTENLSGCKWDDSFIFVKFSLLL